MEGLGLPGEEHEARTDQQVTPGQGMLVEQGLPDLVEIQSHFLFAGPQSPAVTRGHSAVTTESSPLPTAAHPELSRGNNLFPGSQDVPADFPDSEPLASCLLHMEMGAELTPSLPPGRCTSSAWKCPWSSCHTLALPKCLRFALKG